MKQPSNPPSGQPTLEYFVTRGDGRRPQWGFRFLSATGQVVMESSGRFSSRLRAEREFISMMKAVATNPYEVQWSIGINESIAVAGVVAAGWVVPLRRRTRSPRSLLRTRRPRAPR